MSKLYLLLLSCVVLFKANSQAGSLDSTFGNNGIQTTAFLSNANSLDERGQVVLTNVNGDIFVVVRVDYYSTRIAKYLGDRRLDSSYSNAGYSNAVNLVVTSATLQGDKIIVAGHTYNPGSGTEDFALARYTADGTLDSSFGENGKVATDFNNAYDYATSITLQGDKIIVGGSAGLVRYNADGTLDASFGENGIVITEFGVNAIALQGSKIIAAGSALVRYTTNGTLDSSFGINGKATTYFLADAIVLQGDKIIVAGESSGDFAHARYTADGNLDSSFGENGLSEIAKVF